VTKTILGFGTAVCAVAAVALLSSPAKASQGAVRSFEIRGDRFAFSPGRIEVQKDDVVKISFTAVDMAHSFTMDGAYRIAKRAPPGQTVTFEFRASGSERFYCNLNQDERCKEMHGELVVK
jgi:plastocyanin